MVEAWFPPLAHLKHSSKALEAQESLACSVARDSSHHKCGLVDLERGSTAQGLSRLEAPARLHTLTQAKLPTKPHVAEPRAKAEAEPSCSNSPMSGTASLDSLMRIVKGCKICYDCHLAI